MPWTVTSFGCSNSIVQITNVRVGSWPAQIKLIDAAMLADDVIVGDTLSFEALLDVCADLETKINSEHL